MEKTYKIRGRKGCWWIIFHNENGYHHSAIFTAKRDLKIAVKAFIEQGYTEQND